ncbi:MAG: 4-hydroxyphenylpyruvate dioxygenase [Bdellovibrionaceae bacterium]|nr:4-hydroxyphenylpyruvate dioxygenase [Pseudobdellovibrionaceae bacterium]
MSSQDTNPLGILGVEFVEFSGPHAFDFPKLFTKLSFSKTAQSGQQQIFLYQQGKIRFILNNEKGTFAQNFTERHGPAVSSTGFMVQDANHAFKIAVARGAKAFDTKSGLKTLGEFPAVYGIGDSLVYFVDKNSAVQFYETAFGIKGELQQPKGSGLQIVDHFTNNVPKGEMQKWCDFYTNIFGFREARYFDIRGKSTGLISKVMRSPCGTFSIPINEPTGTKSQIQEYLDEYKGSGIQHIALTTNNIINSLTEIKQKDIEFLTPPPKTYYQMLKDRLPNVVEAVDELEKNAILADGDHDGYLLQIFTKNMIGPIFFEIIQRENHHGFGDGNFQALFDAIERDQAERGYL